MTMTLDEWGLSMVGKYVEHKGFCGTIAEYWHPNGPTKKPGLWFRLSPQDAKLTIRGKRLKPPMMFLYAPTEGPNKVNKQRQEDAAETGFKVFQEFLKRTEKDPLAVELGRRGGLKGGRARAEKLTPEERSNSARHAALARWSKEAEQTP